MNSLLLLKLYFKRLTRDTILDVNLFLKFIVFISLGYIYFGLLLSGIFFNQMMQYFNHLSEPIAFFNSILFYILILGIILLFVIKQYYPIEVLQILNFPISRNVISKFLIVSSILNFFNFGFILFFIPFFVINIGPNINWLDGLYYFSGVIILIILGSLFTLLLKSLLRFSFNFLIIPLIILLLLFFYHSRINSLIFVFLNRLLEGDYSAFLSILIILILFILLSRIILRELFYEVVIPPSKMDLIDGESIKLSKNIFNNYLLLEIRLITRNKRLQGFTIMALILLGFFFAFLKKNVVGIYDGFILYTLISGTFGYIYSQYMFSWESSFFDFLIARKFAFKEYLKSKYLLYISSSVLVFIIFLFNNPSFLRISILLSATIYNISIGYFLFFLSATTNTSKIDLEGNILFNLQGFNPIQMVMLIIILFVPCLVLFLLNVILIQFYSLMIFDSICLISIFFIPQWMNLILFQLMRRKYKILEYS